MGLRPATSLQPGTLRTSPHQRWAGRLHRLRRQRAGLGSPRIKDLATGPPCRTRPGAPTPGAVVAGRRHRALHDVDDAWRPYRVGGTGSALPSPRTRWCPRSRTSASTSASPHPQRELRHDQEHECPDQRGLGCSTPRILRPVHRGGPCAARAWTTTWSTPGTHPPTCTTTAGGLEVATVSPADPAHGRWYRTRPGMWPPAWTCSPTTPWCGSAATADRAANPAQGRRAPRSPRRARLPAGPGVNPEFERSRTGCPSPAGHPGPRSTTATWPPASHPAQAPAGASLAWRWLSPTGSGDYEQHRELGGGPRRHRVPTHRPPQGHSA